jgi:hypothetical protein
MKQEKEILILYFAPVYDTVAAIRIHGYEKFFNVTGLVRIKAFNSRRRIEVFDIIL